MEKNRKRPYVIVVHLNEDEYSMINQRVAESRLTREDYIRTLISGYIPNAKPHEDFLETIKQLRYIGNNLNQLAMIANKNHLIDSEDLKKEIMFLNDQIKEIREKVYLPRRIE